MQHAPGYGKVTNSGRFVRGLEANMRRNRATQPGRRAWMRAEKHNSVASKHGCTKLRHQWRAGPRPTTSIANIHHSPNRDGTPPLQATHTWKVGAFDRGDHQARSEVSWRHTQTTMQRYKPGSAKRQQGAVGCVHCCANGS